MHYKVKHNFVVNTSFYFSETNFQLKAQTGIRKIFGEKINLFSKEV